MNTEKLIEKGVKKVFTGKEVLFNVLSLEEHYDGLEIHKSDILFIDEVAYLKAGDINGENAKPKKVKPIEEIEVVAQVVTPKKRTSKKK